ncbi:MAG: addiction module protein [Ignavibacteria bacterium]|jgi:putative addiction module component (TIGR02574 family)|nr:addiction module protein [Ignavibacteria bacterium]
MSDELRIKSLNDIKSLSIKERIFVVEEIWDSIMLSQEEFPISEEQKQLLDARLESHQRNPEEGKSWTEVKNMIQKHS